MAPDQRARPTPVAALTLAVLAAEVPTSTDAERRDVVRRVEESVAAMPDWTRAGVRASAALAVGVRSLRRGRASGLPLVGEAERAVRSLALVALYDARAEVAR